jgi:hypothetical protein
MVKPKAKQEKYVEINWKQNKRNTLKLVQCMARFWTHLFDEGKCYENEREEPPRLPSALDHLEGWKPQGVLNSWI